MRFKQVAIVIPVYKERLHESEIISLKQCFQVLRPYEILLVGPKDLNFTHYKELLQNDEYGIRLFDRKFFIDINGYNNLLKSLEFYQAFSEYEYILIHQLDAYVFRDELLQWIGKGYDFIGAPWFKGWFTANANNEIIGAGNGGFSLRNVQSFIRLLNRYNHLTSLRRLWVKSRLNSVLSFERMVVKFSNRFLFRNKNRLDSNIFEFEGNEDYFWSLLIAPAFSDFSIAPLTESIKFSFEVNPSYLFEMNNNELPFGCHAWERYEPDFWKKFIKQPGEGSR